jgi:hypothetical protein
MGPPKHQYNEPWAVSPHQLNDRCDLGPCCGHLDVVTSLVVEYGDGRARRTCCPHFVRLSVPREASSLLSVVRLRNRIRNSVTILTGKTITPEVEREG